MDKHQKELIEELLFSSKKQPSFAKMLYFGFLFGADVFPYPCVSDDEKESTDAFLERISVFANEHIDADKIDRESKIPDEVIVGLGKLGVLGMSIPKEYGGLGLSQYAYCKVEEALSSVCSSTALFVNAHQSVGLKALVLFGTEEQKNAYLPKLSSGEHIAAFSLTEPNAGSDAAGIEARASYNEEKNSYTIKGEKQWTTNGSIAKVLTVMAKTALPTPHGTEDKITAFIVTSDMPGFRILDKSLEKVGMRGTWTSNLEYDNVEVPAKNVLGPIGGGLRVCLTVLDYGRTTFGAMCTGMAKVCEKMAISHAIHRHQFKRPLASFTLVKEKIALISALTYAMDATTYLTAGLIDKRVEDIMVESAILKVFASDCLWKILYETMQIYGGKSFFTDEPLERMMRDARLNMVGEGSNEVMRVFIGSVGLRDIGMLFKNFVDHPFHPMTYFRAIKFFWKKLFCPKVPVVSPQLKAAAKALGKDIRRFGFAVFRSLVKYKEQVIEQQLVLNRIAESAIAIYTSVAVLSKLDDKISRKQLERNELRKGIFYCEYASKNLRQNLDRLFDPFDKEIDTLSDNITGIRR